MGDGGGEGAGARALAPAYASMTLLPISQPATAIADAGG